MDNNVLTAFAITFVAGASTSIGALLAFFVRKQDFRTMAMAMSFSAGVMIFVSFADIMPMSARLLERAKENGLTRPQADARLIAFYTESGDVCAAAKLAAKDGVRCPPKVMLSPEMNPYSDKFVLLPEAERLAFVKKHEETQRKFEAYKKLFFLK